MEQWCFAAEPTAFSEEHARLLEQIAGQFAIAVDNALNFQHAQRERDRRQLLLEVSNAVVSNLTLRELLLAVSNWLHKFFAHDWASMVIRDDESGQLRVHALNAPAPRTSDLDPAQPHEEIGFKVIRGVLYNS